MTSTSPGESVIFLSITQMADWNFSSRTRFCFREKSYVIEVYSTSTERAPL